MKAHANPCPAAILAVLFLAMAATNSAQAQDGEGASLTVVSWGGAYTRSQILAYVEPYEEQTDATIVVEDYNGGLAQLRAQVEAYNTKWDILDMELPDLIRACDQGLLEPIDHGFLEPAPDGTPAQEDFLPGLLPECGVGQVVFSTVIAYDKAAFGDAAPQTLADFFDLTQFPGKRGLRRSPTVNLEWALMADGVAPEDVYDTLSTDEGVERAFDKLDAIKSSVVWWESGAEPAQLLSSGAVAMSSGWNGRLGSAIDAGVDIDIVWDHQVLQYDLWGVPKRTRNQNMNTILAFVSFATSTERLAEQAKYITYGPARKSSMELIPEPVKPRLPTAPDNAQVALQLDGAWWAENQARLDQRFSEWLQKRSFFFGGGMRP